MLVDHVLPGGGAHHAGARDREPGLLVGSLGQHGDELTDANARDIALDGEVDRNRLIAVDKTGPAEREAELPGADPRAGAIRVEQGLIAERLHPETSRIDDVEDDGVGLRDLTGDRRAVRDDAVDRR